MTDRLAPLAGVKVLDLTRVLAGPWCTMNLADLGADVIKVEQPGSGDDTRGWGPPFLKDQAGDDTSEAAYYLAMNRNKRSVTVDMASPEGQEVLHRLVSRADVLVENFKVGGLAKYGLDYAALARQYPRLIYCSITGFGQTGPYAKRPGYDYIIQGMSGLMSVTGERDAVPGGGPQKVGVAVTDVMTGMYATLAILAALRERDGTIQAPGSGLGQHIDMALMDCSLAMLANLNMNYLTTGKAPVRLGNAHPNIVPYQVFAVADGHLILAVGNDQQFRSCCHVLGCAPLADDPRFDRNRDRVANREALIALMAPRFLTQPRAAWLAALAAAGVPCGPINTLDQVFADPQVVARELRLDLPHASAGTAPSVANPIRLSATPIQYRAAPPLLGQHTHAVLQELGYASEDVARLRARKVIEG
jgi:crotonobetainyl-CoA:carnitine CoA-transferase CaiB-like acyl-CoA transferase